MKNGPRLFDWSKLPTDTPPNKITEITEQNNNNFSEIEYI